MMIGILPGPYWGKRATQHKRVAHVYIISNWTLFVVGIAAVEEEKEILKQERLDAVEEGKNLKEERLDAVEEGKNLIQEWLDAVEEIWPSLRQGASRFVYNSLLLIRKNNINNNNNTK